jgi:hypothetical protein
MTRTRWQRYLAEYSADVLRCGDVHTLERIGAQRYAAGWLGFDGADPERLTAVEQRLTAAVRR